jgi:hypothetical protein
MDDQRTLLCAKEDHVADRKFHFGPQHALVNRVGRPTPSRAVEDATTKCGKYLGDNDATCPQLTCIRDHGHEGLCDNVRSDR